MAKITYKSMRVVGCTKKDHICVCGKVIAKGSKCRTILEIDYSKRSDDRLVRKYLCGRCSAWSWFRRLFGLSK